MAQIVITGHTSFSNRGNEALIRSIIQALAASIPNAAFTVFSQSPRMDNNAYEKERLCVRFLQLTYNPASYAKRGKAWYFLQTRLGLSIPGWTRVDPISYQAVKNCDLLVVSGGDLFSGYGLDAMKQHASLALIASALKKPVIIYAHSFNPFPTQEELEFGRFFLNQATLITVREKISERYLKEIGIRTPIYLAADPAFLLPCAPLTRVESIMASEGIPTDQPLAGISASAGMAWYVEGAYDKYLTILAALADYLIERHGLRVVFVPHVVGPNMFGGDDRRASDEVIERVKSQHGAFPIRGEYNCSELKGLAGRCQLFVGSRMHATVASASMLVPTINLAYSIKAHGVLGDLVQSRTIVYNVKELQLGDLLCRVDDLLDNWDAVVRELSINLVRVKERAQVTPMLAAKLISGKQIQAPVADKG